MRGAQEANGTIVGVLSENLEKVALSRENRDLIVEGKLTLISPYDPLAGFNVGNAMQRNKLIYALSKMALVVSSDYQKGGTWAGAFEQLEKFRFVPIYVRSTGEPQKGLEALRKLGALPWPNPQTIQELESLFHDPINQNNPPLQNDLPLSLNGANQAINGTSQKQSLPEVEQTSRSIQEQKTLAEELFNKVIELLSRTKSPKTEAQVAEELGVSKSQAREWLLRLVENGQFEKLSKPVRYRSSAHEKSLFEYTGA